MEPGSALARMASATAGGESKHLAAALKAGDGAARRVLQETAEDLAFGLSHVVHLFHPQIIILGGGLAGVGEWLRSAVEGELRRFIMEAFAPGPGWRWRRWGRCRAGGSILGAGEGRIEVSH